MKLLTLFLLCLTVPLHGGILESWNDTQTRTAIIEFVESVTTPASDAFVPPAQRVAVFDNDGTLWAEKPVYFQLLFAVDRIKAMATDHPEWKTKDPYASVLRGDLKGLAAGGEKTILELIMATHSGMTSDEFEGVVTDWLKTARHPVTGKRYTEMTYQPMMELLDYLRENDFKVFIVSGGGIAFMRPWTEAVYGIPRENVVGSRIASEFEYRDGVPVIVRQPRIAFIDDKQGKPIGIYEHIGRRPIFAAGNSDGDLQMLQWTHAGDGLRFCLYLHHTDAEREWAYDRDSHVGSLDKGLKEAADKGWTVIDMKEDWARVFPE